MSEETQRSAPGWVMPLTEYGPLVAFFIAYLLADLMTATAVVMVAAAVAVAVSFVLSRKIPWVPLVTASIVGVFGGLTLYLQDETFIKMKPTIVQVLFAGVLFGGMLFNKLPLKLLMGRTHAMPDGAWRTLTLRFAIFFIVMAALNEAVWRTQTESFWVSFKVFGITALTFVFVATQIPFMMRHAVHTDD
ncbi:MAG: septation protein A [Alphaproteobacteria bacterium]